MLKKRIVPTLLALCLLLSALPFTALAAVPGSQEVDSLEGFLNRLISAGTLYDYNGAKYDYEHLDGAGTGYCGYAKVLGSSIFYMLSGLRLESYGVKASYTQSGKKGCPSKTPNGSAPTSSTGPRPPGRICWPKPPPIKGSSAPPAWASP